MTPIREDIADIRLETSSLVLRPWEDRDREAMADIQGDPHVRRYFLRPLTRQEAFDDIDLAQARARENGFHFQAAELKATGELVGQIGIGVVPEKTRAAIPSHPRVEIGWVLAPRFWGQGLAPEGARAWLDYAWSIGLDEIVAFTAKKNLPSQRVMQKSACSASLRTTTSIPRSRRVTHCARTWFSASASRHQRQARSHEYQSEPVRPCRGYPARERSWSLYRAHQGPLSLPMELGFLLHSAGPVALRPDRA